MKVLARTKILASQQCYIQILCENDETIYLIFKDRKSAEKERNKLIKLIQKDYDDYWREVQNLNGTYDKNKVKDAVPLESIWEEDYC